MFKNIILLIFSVISLNSFSMGKRSADFDREEKRVERGEENFIQNFVDQLLIKGKLELEDFSIFLNEKEDLVLELLDSIETRLYTDSFFTLVRWFLNEFLYLKKFHTFKLILQKYKEKKQWLDSKNLLVQIVDIGYIDIFVYAYEFFNINLNGGLSINFSCDHTTLLSIAAKNNNLEMIKILLRLGADINVANDRGVTPLMSISENQKNINLEVLKFFLANGASVESKDTEDKSIFHKLLEFENCVEAFKVLFENFNFNINSECDCPNGAPGTYLIYLVQLSSTHDNNNKKLDLIKLFLKKGADYRLMDRDGFDALYYAIVNGLDDVVEVLLRYGAKFFKKDFNFFEVMEAYFDYMDSIPRRTFYQDEVTKRLVTAKLKELKDNTELQNLIYGINNNNYCAFQINLKTLNHLYDYRAHFLDERSVRYVIPQ